MHLTTGIRLLGSLFLAVVLVGLGGSDLRAQATDPPKKLPPAKAPTAPAADVPSALPDDGLAAGARIAPPAKSVDQVETLKASVVFPEGGFPATPPVPEGGIPAATPTKPRPTQYYPDAALQPATTDYGPPGGKYLRDYQDAPGAGEYYIPRSSPLPPYYYQQSYYERGVVSPHSALIYAPPGYEARDQQVTPGTPEFTLITPPEPVTPEERARFVTRGIFPGSFLVPGTNTSVRIRGFVRLTGMYDFNPIGTPDIFVTNTIPVPQTRGTNYNMTARPSRIAFETWTPTSFKEWTLHTFVEGDFFNGPGQAVGGGGNPFRLRHAFIDYGYFRIGQQNTVFMDASTWPSLVDFQGPAGWQNQRRPGVRVTLPICDNLFWAGGIEQPFSDITTNGLGTNVQDVPDFATHVRYEGDIGHVQLSGIWRSIGYRPTGGSKEQRGGYGLSASTTFHPWAWLMCSNPLRKDNPTGLERCRLIGQYAFGHGIGRYFLDTAGLGLDGQVNAANGSFDLPYVATWVLSYEHWYCEQVMSQVTWSEVLASSTDGQPGNTYIGAKYVAFSTWYIPFANMSLGIEYLYGERENVNTQRGTARRLNALVQYNF